MYRLWNLELAVILSRPFHYIYLYGREFEMVLFDEKAKTFLLENLESIMYKEDMREEDE